MSMERIYPDNIQTDEITGSETLQLHLDRYHYAGRHLQPGYVADIACGTGYGSYLLATEYGEKIKQVIAADIDETSIAYATKRYTHTQIRFVTADALHFDPGVVLNNIVSLETIEHLNDPRSFIQHVSKYLATGGRFIASAPVTPSMDANPYHLHDFTISSFKKMFREAGMKEIDSFIQVQRYNPLPLIQRKEKRSEDLRKNVLRFYLDHPGKFFSRLSSIVRDGFANKYAIVVFEKL